MTNTAGGVISANALNIGVHLFNSDASGTNPLTFSGTTVTATNAGSVTDGYGVRIGSGMGGISAINISAGTVTLENTAALTGGVSTAVGAYMQGSALNVSGTGVLLIESATGALSGPQLGAQCVITTGNFTQSGGTVTVENTSSISSGFTGTPAAVSLLVNGGGSAINQTGGLFVVDNTGAVASSVASTGALMQGVSLTTSASAGTSLVENGGIISGNSGNVGAELSVGTMTLNAGTLMALNHSPATLTAGIGTLVNVTGALSIGASGTFDVYNFAPLAAAGTGVVVDIGTGVTTAGTLTLENMGTGNPSGTANSVQFNVISGNFSQTGGTVTVENIGHTQSTYTGTPVVSLLVNGGGSAINQTGGSFQISNVNSIASTAASTGALVQGLSFTSSGSAGASTLGNSGVLSGSTGNIGSELSVGTMTLNAGTLTALNSPSGALTAGTGCLVNVTGSLSIGGGGLLLYNDAPLSTSGTGALATIGGGFTLSAGVLTLGNNGVNLGGTASGAGMHVTGGSFSQTGGTVYLEATGTNSGTGQGNYIQSTPPITISGAGSLFHNYIGVVAAPSLTLTNGATLQVGSSTVPGVFEDASFGGTTDVINNGGIFVSGSVSPAKPGQTLIEGTYTQNSGTFALVFGRIFLPNNQGLSFLTVDGTGVVNLNGGTLDVIPSINIETEIAYVTPGPGSVQFIQASSAINGAFTPAQIINGLEAYGLKNLTYQTIDGNQGWLNFVYAPPASLTLSSTPVLYAPITMATINYNNMFIQREILRVHDRMKRVNLDGRKESKGAKPHSPRGRNNYRAPFASLSQPEQSETPSNITTANTIADPVIAARNPLFGFTQTQAEQQRLSREVARCTDKPWDVYIGPLGNVGKVNNKHSQLGLNYRSVGVLTGFDYAFSQVGVGFMVDYENVKAHVHKHEGKFWANQFHANTYATYVPESLSHFALNAIVGAGGAWYSIQRNIFGLTTSESTKGKSRGAIANALVGAEYTFAHSQFDDIPCGLEISPLLNLQYVYQGLGSYKEYGTTDFDLKFHKQGFQSLRTTLGTWLRYEWSWENFSITPLVDIAWQREFLDRNHKLYTTPIESVGPITTTGTTIFGAGRNTLLAGLDLMFEFYDTYGIEASYDFEYNSLYRNNEFFVGFHISF
jgi:hypothetical protein